MGRSRDSGYQVPFQCDLRLLDCRAVMDWTMNTSF